MPDPGAVVSIGLLVFAAMIAAALIWLAARDRLGALSLRAVGDYGPLVASGVGLLVGVAAAALNAAVMRRWPVMREIETTAKAALEGTGENGVLALVVVGALAEEVFFRLAVQDQFGLFGSVAACVLVNSCLGSLRLLPFVLVHALALGLLVHCGFGLLGSTTAHAIMNHLNLRRIQCT